MALYGTRCATSPSPTPRDYFDARDGGHSEVQTIHELLLWEEAVNERSRLQNVLRLSQFFSIRFLLNLEFFLEFLVLSIVRFPPLIWSFPSKLLRSGARAQRFYKIFKILGWIFLKLTEGAGKVWSWSRVMKFAPYNSNTELGRMEWQRWFLQVNSVGWSISVYTRVFSWNFKGSKV